MFDAGFWELLVIGVLALVVVGPERLPRLARTVGLWVGRARHAFYSVRDEIEREADAEGLRDTERAIRESVRETEHDVRQSVRETEHTVRQSVRETEDGIKADDPAAGSPDGAKRDDVTGDAGSGSGSGEPTPEDDKKAPSAGDGKNRNG